MADKSVDEKIAYRIGERLAEIAGTLDGQLSDVGWANTKSKIYENAGANYEVALLPVHPQYTGTVKVRGGVEGELNISEPAIRICLVKKQPYFSSQMEYINKILPDGGQKEDGIEPNRGHIKIYPMENEGMMWFPLQIDSYGAILDLGVAGTGGKIYPVASLRDAGDFEELIQGRRVTLAGDTLQNAEDEHNEIVNAMPTIAELMQITDFKQNREGLCSREQSAFLHGSLSANAPDGRQILMKLLPYYVDIQTSRMFGDVRTTGHGIVASDGHPAIFSRIYTPYMARGMPRQEDEIPQKMARTTPETFQKDVDGIIKRWTKEYELPAHAAGITDSAECNAATPGKQQTHPEAAISVMQLYV